MTNWIELWKTLVRQREDARRPDPGQDPRDRWCVRAADYDEHTRRRWDHPDSSRDFLVATLAAMPDATLLDIGAGGGKWAVPLAPHVRHLTAVEPSAAMRRYLQAHLAEARIANVSIIPEAWPCQGIEAHDVALCSHAMYGFHDFPAFVRSLEAAAGRLCVLLMRAPPLNGVMAQIALQLWGHPYDSANFAVAFNALLQMGIHPNVQMEAPQTWEPWVYSGFDEALQDIRNHFRLYAATPHDAGIQDLVRRHLVRTEEGWALPHGTATALIYWRPGTRAAAQT